MTCLFFIQADTTAVGYRIGYTIGSWLPFIIVGIIAIMVIVKGYRHGNDDKRTL
jgi:hypothetical protein